MSYNTKNYTKQGGDKTVIGGTLEILPEGKIEGLPKADNVAASSATTVSALKDNFNTLLENLKDAGYVEKDYFACTIALAPSPTEPQLVGNHSKIESVSVDADTVTVTGPLSELTEFPSSDPAQGTHKWIALSIGTGLDSIIGVKYNGTALTQTDVDEATAVGCSAGAFVLYLKCDEVVATAKTFTLSKKGYHDKSMNIVFVNSDEE